MMIRRYYCDECHTEIDPIPELTVRYAGHDLLFCSSACKEAYMAWIAAAEEAGP